MTICGGGVQTEPAVRQQYGTTSEHHVHRRGSTSANFGPPCYPPQGDLEFRLSPKERRFRAACRRSVSPDRPPSQPSCALLLASLTKCCMRTRQATHETPTCGSRDSWRSSMRSTVSQHGKPARAMPATDGLARACAVDRGRVCCTRAGAFRDVADLDSARSNLVGRKRRASMSRRRHRNDLSRG